MLRFRGTTAWYYLLVLGLASAASFVAGNVLGNPAPPKRGTDDCVACICRDIEAYTVETPAGFGLAQVYFDFDAMGTPNVSTQCFTQGMYSTKAKCQGGVCKIAGSVYWDEIDSPPVCTWNPPLALGQAEAVECFAFLPANPTKQFKAQRRTCQ